MCSACSGQPTSPCERHPYNVCPSFPQCSITSAPSLTAWGTSVRPRGCASPLDSLQCSGSLTWCLHLLPSLTPRSTPAGGTSSWLLLVFRSWSGGPRLISRWGGCQYALSRKCRDILLTQWQPTIFSSPLYPPHPFINIFSSIFTGGVAPRSQSPSCPKPWLPFSMTSDTMLASSPCTACTDRGGATAVYQQSLDRIDIKCHGLWTSDAFWQYIT